MKPEDKSRIQSLISDRSGLKSRAQCLRGLEEARRLLQGFTDR